MLHLTSSLTNQRLHINGLLLQSRSYILIHPTVALIPEAISADCDQDLRNAISLVFPYYTTLICLWNANKIVQQYCKPKFDSRDTYEDFF